MRTLRVLVAACLVSLLALLAFAPGASAHPVSQCNADGGSWGGQGLWVQDWLNNGPIDPNGDGLHKFNSVGCEGYTIFLFEWT